MHTSGRMLVPPPLLLLLCLALLVGCRAAPASPSNWWSNCGGDHDHFSFELVALHPNPPIRGQNATIGICGTLDMVDETVTYGVGSVELYFSSILLLNCSKSLCDTPTISCPIPAGPLLYGHTFEVPNKFPTGAYDLKVVLQDQNFQEIACALITFSLN